MNRALFSISLLLGLLPTAQAHLQPSITEYVQFSTTVCVAKASAVKDGVITFTVEEIVKGPPPATLTLRVIDVPVAIDLNSEWLLVSTIKNENTLGWANKGDRGWVNAPIQRVDGKIHLVGKYGYIDPDLAANPSKGMTLEQLKDLAKQPLPKN